MTTNFLSACRRTIALAILSMGAVHAAQTTTTLANGNQSYTIFNWTLSGTTGDTYTTFQGNPNNTQVAIQSAFNIVLSGVDFTNSAWLSPKSWQAFTTLKNDPTFSSFTLSGSTPTRGSFGYQRTGTGMNVTWTPSMLPEPTSALAGLLMAGGLLRRRR